RLAGDRLGRCRRDQRCRHAGAAEVAGVEVAPAGAARAVGVTEAGDGIALAADDLTVAVLALRLVDEAIHRRPPVAVAGGDDLAHAAAARVELADAGEGAGAGGTAATGVAGDAADAAARGRAVAAGGADVVLQRARRIVHQRRVARGEHDRVEARRALE